MSTIYNLSSYLIRGSNNDCIAVADGNDITLTIGVSWESGLNVLFTVGESILITTSPIPEEIRPVKRVNKLMWLTDDVDDNCRAFVHIEISGHITIEAIDKDFAIIYPNDKYLMSNVIINYNNRSNVMGKIMYKNIPFTGTMKTDHVELTQLQYDALSTEEKNDPDKIYFVRDGIPTPSNLADYVVEQGIESIWTYRKWNSGIAECWGHQDVPSTTYSANGGYKAVSIALPSGLFITSPDVVNASGRISNVVHTTMGFTSPNNADTIQTYLINRGTSATTQAGVVYWNVKGRWK